MVDGSFLFASINRIRKAKEDMKESKLQLDIVLITSVIFGGTMSKSLLESHTTSRKPTLV